MLTQGGKLIYVHTSLFLQKDHVLVSMNDLMSRYEPKVEPERYDVRTFFEVIILIFALLLLKYFYAPG
jgi:hypothetical protein